MLLFGLAACGDDNDKPEKSVVEQTVKSDDGNKSEKTIKNTQELDAKASQASDEYNDEDEEDERREEEEIIDEEEFEPLPE
jgi:hypothetical protein